MDEKPNYYAVIPANVRYDKNLRPMAKLLYGEISALAQKDGKCWATNSYFAELYGMAKESISRLISSLTENGYIKIEIVYEEGTHKIVNRYIQICHEGIDEKIKTPIDEKVKENNTSNEQYKNEQYKINNRESKERKSKPPTLEEVEDYVNEKKLNVNPQRFIDYYEATGWKDKDGKSVKSWKRQIDNMGWTQ